MNRSSVLQLVARTIRARLLWVGLALLVSGGCHGGKSANPFATGATRVPPPSTRSVQTPAGGYYQGPAGAPGAPAAIGTGVTGSGVAPTNWSSTPGAVGGTSNNNGVYTSWLEKTDSGYTVKSSANATPPPATGAPASSAPPSSSPSFPKTQLQTSGNSWLEPATTGVNPASFSEPAPAAAAPPPENLQWRTTR